MHDDPDSLNQAAAAAIAAEAWTQVEADWGASEQHQQFVQICADLDLLDFAAKRYADSRLTRPGDPMVRKMANQLVFLAQLRLEQERPRKPDKAETSRLKLAILVLVLLLTPLLFLKSLVGSRESLLQSRLDAVRVSLAQGDEPAARSELVRLLKMQPDYEPALELLRQLDARSPGRTPAALPPEAAGPAPAPRR